MAQPPPILFIPKIKKGKKFGNGLGTYTPQHGPKSKISVYIQYRIYERQEFIISFPPGIQQFH